MQESVHCDGRLERVYVGTSSRFPNVQSLFISLRRGRLERRRSSECNVDSQSQWWLWGLWRPWRARELFDENLPLKCVASTRTPSYYAELESIQHLPQDPAAHLLWQYTPTLTLDVTFETPSMPTEFHRHSSILAAFTVVYSGVCT